LPPAINALACFCVPFLAGLPAVVAQAGDASDYELIRHWDVYIKVFERGPNFSDYIVGSIHLLLTSLFGVALFFTTQRLRTRSFTFEFPRNKAGVHGAIVTLLVVTNIFLIRQDIWIASASRPSSSSIHELPAGTQIPEFQLVCTDRLEVRHDPNSDRVLLISFFATWCGPCIQEMPKLQEIWDDNRENPNFGMVVVGLREENGTLARFKDEHRYTIPFATDTDGSIYKLFDLDGAIPHTCLLKRGAVQLSIAGYDERRLDGLARLLATGLADTRLDEETTNQALNGSRRASPAY
jgi:peroxiredoxin